MSHTLQWWRLEGVSEEGQEEVTLYHWFEAAITFNCCSTVSQGVVGLSGASKRVAVTFSSWKFQWVLFMVGFCGLLKTTSWQMYLPIFSKYFKHPVININLSQQLERSDQECNLWLELGGWLQVIEQLSKLLNLSESQFSLLKNRVSITCLSGPLGLLNKTIHVKHLALSAQGNPSGNKVSF